MTYSSALFGGDPSIALEDAQRREVRADAGRAGAAARIARPRDRLRLGRLRRVSRRARGHRVTGLSLSDAQTAYARERLARRGLSDRVRVPDPGLPRRARRLRRRRVDRDVRGGRRELLARVLPPRAASRCSRAGARASRPSPSPTSASSATARSPTSSSSTSSPAACWPRRRDSLADADAAGLALERGIAFGPDYAETLKRWLAAFDTHRDAVRAQGFDERFIRCWRFYLAYCAAGFDSGSTDVAQYTLRAN